MDYSNSCNGRVLISYSDSSCYINCPIYSIFWFRIIYSSFPQNIPLPIESTNRTLKLTASAPSIYFRAVLWSKTEILICGHIGSKDQNGKETTIKKRVIFSPILNQYDSFLFWESFNLSSRPTASKQHQCVVDSCVLFIVLGPIWITKL